MKITQICEICEIGEIGDLTHDVVLHRSPIRLQGDQQETIGLHTRSEKLGQRVFVQHHTLVNVRNASPV